MAAAGPAGLRIFGGDAELHAGTVDADHHRALPLRRRLRWNAGRPAQNWTVPGPDRPRRIDFLFSRHEPTNGPAVVTDFKTVTFAAANAAAQQVTGGDNPAEYSDHRALTARIHY